MLNNQDGNKKQHGGSRSGAGRKKDPRKTGKIRGVRITDENWAWLKSKGNATEEINVLIEQARYKERK